LNKLKKDQEEGLTFNWINRLKLTSCKHPTLLSNEVGLLSPQCWWSIVRVTSGVHRQYFPAMILKLCHASLPTSTWIRSKVARFWQPGPGLRTKKNTKSNFHWFAQNLAIKGYIPGNFHFGTNINIQFNNFSLIFTKLGNKRVNSRKISLWN
jgi:hypothetical protein